MHLVRYQTEDPGDGTARVGVLRDGSLTALPGVATMSRLLGLRLDELRAAVDEGLRHDETRDAAGVRLLPPIDGRGEVWCAGVTYERSRGARMEESSEQSIYDRVYVAARPELFPKSPAWRLVTDGEPIGIRADSGHDVPEPELTVVVNRHGETVGYGVCNDVSSRSIEGENPLYLPQAKVFAGGCAVSPGVRPVWEVPDANDLAITMTVRRNGAVAFEGGTSTAQLARTLDDLVTTLFAANDFPDGVVLATGTGIVPEFEFALQAGDVVEIDVDQVGRLSNQVVLGKGPFTRLCDNGASTAATVRPHLEEAR
jgi:2-dehydro-3-deoxy-D-arabinonate dehydratase